jgi:hypothetical protein
MAKPAELEAKIKLITGDKVEIQDNSDRTSRFS